MTRSDEKRKVETKVILERMSKDGVVDPVFYQGFTEYGKERVLAYFDGPKVWSVARRMRLEDDLTEIFGVEVFLTKKSNMLYSDLARLNLSNSVVLKPNMASAELEFFNQIMPTGVAVEFVSSGLGDSVTGAIDAGVFSSASAPDEVAPCGDLGAPTNTANTLSS